MSHIMKELINNKIKKLKTSDLIHVSSQYGFSLSDIEANEIINYLKQHEFDVFSKSDHNRIYQELTNITNKTTADKAKRLFDQMIVDYGLARYLHD